MKFPIKNAFWVYIHQGDTSWFALMCNNIFISPFTEDGVDDNEYIIYQILPDMIIIPLSADIIQGVHELLNMQLA
jgi:hypothetical protein